METRTLNMVKYDLKSIPGYRWTGDPQQIGERLEALLEDQQGELTPYCIVEDAKNESSPLHPNFEWDDRVAAEKQRIQTARALVASVIVVEVQETKIEEPIRAFVNVRKEDKSHYYTTTVNAMSHEDLQRQVIKDAWNELQKWRRRYAHLQEFSELVRKMHELQPEITSLLKLERTAIPT